MLEDSGLQCVCLIDSHQWRERFNAINSKMARLICEGRLHTLNFPHPAWHIELFLMQETDMAEIVIPGAGLGGKPMAYSQSVCHIDHAALAAERYEQFITDPGPIMVGAVQGTSCFGSANAG